MRTAPVATMDPLAGFISQLQAGGLVMAWYDPTLGTFAETKQRGRFAARARSVLVPRDLLGQLPGIAQSTASTVIGGGGTASARRVRPSQAKTTRASNRR